MTWPFYSLLHGNSGVTPPYSNVPQGSSWPFYTNNHLTERGGAGGSRLPVPYQPKPMAPMGNAGLPATTGAPGLPATTGGAGLPATTEVPNNALDFYKQHYGQPGNGLPSGGLDIGGMLRKLLPTSGLGAAAGGVLGPVGALLGMTSPAGNAADNGTGELLKQPTFPQGVPLPQSRPPFEDMGNPYAGGMPNSGGNVPLPRPNPLAQVAATNSGTLGSLFGNPAPLGGPGSMSFGAGDPSGGIAGGMTSGNTVGQTDLLAQLLRKLGGQ